MLESTSLNFTSQRPFLTEAFPHRGFSSKKLFLFSEDERKSHYLQITDLYLLRRRDCKRMCRFIQIEQFLGLSEGGEIQEKARYWHAGGFFDPFLYFLLKSFQICAFHWKVFSFVPVKRFRQDRVHCSSPTQREALVWLSKRFAPWRYKLEGRNLLSFTFSNLKRTQMKRGTRLPSLTKCVSIGISLNGISLEPSVSKMAVKIGPNCPRTRQWVLLDNARLFSGV